MIVVPCREGAGAAAGGAGAAVGVGVGASVAPAFAGEDGFAPASTASDGVGRGCGDAAADRSASARRRRVWPAYPAGTAGRRTALLRRRETEHGGQARWAAKPASKPRAILDARTGSVSDRLGRLGQACLGVRANPWSVRRFAHWPGAVRTTGAPSHLRRRRRAAWVQSLRRSGSEPAIASGGPPERAREREPGVGGGCRPDSSRKYARGPPRRPPLPHVFASAEHAVEATEAFYGFPSWISSSASSSVKLVASSRRRCRSSRGPQFHFKPSESRSSGGSSSLRAKLSSGARAVTASPGLARRRLHGLEQGGHQVAQDPDRF